MKKIRITEEDLRRMVEDAAAQILKHNADAPHRDIKYDEDGNEIPEFEQDMYDMKKFVPFDKAHTNWDALGAPSGWQKLYLKARRNQVKSHAAQMNGDAGDMGTSLDNAWVSALKKEYPNPSERQKAFNDFSKKIDAFRGYEPQIYDDVDDNDANAVWNKH